MEKAIAWLVTVTGLFPSFWIGFMSFFSLWTAKNFLNRQITTGASAAYVHDTFISIGGWTITITPHYWSAFAIFLGTLLILVGLIDTLRATE